MKHTVNFNEINVLVTWEGPLRDGTDVYVHTGDPGLAMHIIVLFLDDKGMRNLWYEQSWTADNEEQAMRLCRSVEKNWKNWSRKKALGAKE
ncbi:hypothetical protein [Chitinophaga niabensis]|uniref:Uncharacterized protein n=1 Tax=Chitinophaga niabensis TaxID=536979 RepID=A0A1N6KA79_9BACT|nr:hypothetical protein [Chitinophaga niabensis]SIO53465.1 hypothetical protein SAMN04488055_5420 [Chitinophaga niabensis]